MRVTLHPPRTRSIYISNFNSVYLYNLVSLNSVYLYNSVSLNSIQFLSATQFLLVQFSLFQSKRMEPNSQKHVVMPVIALSYDRVTNCFLLGHTKQMEEAMESQKMVKKFCNLIIIHFYIMTVSDHCCAYTCYVLMMKINIICYSMKVCNSCNRCMKKGINK